MKKNDNHSNQVLNLYEVQEIQQQEEIKKRRVLPIILLMCGIILIGGGFFYNDVVKLIIKEPNGKEKIKTEKKDKNKLKCNYKKEDVSLGISYIYSNSYQFNNKLLKIGETTITISPLPNRDIAIDNIRVLSGKYMDLANTLNNIEGITSSANLKNNIITFKYKIDYQNTDLTKIPKNNQIIINSLDEQYSLVKRKNQENNYLCQ